MADEKPIEQADQAASAAAETEYRAAMERLQALEAEKVRLATENQTYRQVLEQVQRPQATSTAEMGFDATLVNAYRQRGFTDEQIKANLEILAPVLDYAGRQIGGVIQQQATEIQRLRAATEARRPDSKFKDWDVLAPYVEQEQQKAHREGRTLDVDTAYAIAFANNYEKVQAAKTAQDQASASARDATAQRGLASPTTTIIKEDAPPIQSAKDIAALPPEDRKKVWDALADRPF